MLKYEVPHVYHALMLLTKQYPYPEPPVLLIKIVCRGSKDPSFDKPKFKRYLEEYSRTGLYCHRPKQLTPEREKYYERVREKKLREYVGREEI